MNITNLEIIQATIEFSLAFAFIIIAISLLYNKNKRQGMNEIIKMFFVVSAILIFEAGAYIFRGNTDLVFIIANQISNFIVFFLNFFLSSIFIRYVYKIINRNELHVPNRYKILVDLGFILACIILFINIFTGWMYTFDENNFYKRNIMWYVYTTLSLILPIICTILCFKYKPYLSKSIFNSILLYVWLPMLFLIMQVIIYGFSIMTIGMAIDLFIMLVIYLSDLIKTRMNDKEIKQLDINKIRTIILYTFIAIFISSSIISCSVYLSKMIKENNNNNNLITSNMICDNIDSQFQELLTVSATLSQDYYIKESLINSDPNDYYNVEDMIINSLDAIKQGFKYEVVYAVSDISMVYYNNLGFSRCIDRNNYGEDIWYKELTDSSDLQRININTDIDTLDNLIIFANTKVFDDNGNYIGITGVGIKVNSLSNILASFENEYNSKIYLTNPDGLIKVSSNMSLINNKKIDNSFFSNVTNNSFHKTQNTLTKYLSSSNMYLIIEYEKINYYSAFEIIAPSLIIFIIGIFLFGSFVIMTYIENKRAYNTIIEQKNFSLTDEMTELLNRRAFEADVNELANQDLSGYVIIQFDINSLKMTNDVLGHQAGDELIIGAAKCMKETFSDYGKIYRTGGDEFIAIIKCDNTLLEEKMAKFKYLCDNYKGEYIGPISISIGSVSCDDYQNLNLREIIVLADNLMYDNKDIYYETTKNKRRIN